MPAVLTHRDTVLSGLALPVELDETIVRIAEARHVSRDRALADLLRDGIALYERDRAKFFAVANQYQQSGDPTETARLEDELDRLIFGV